VLDVDVALRRGALELDVALRIEAGEAVALVGPSGAGKTTLLRIVAGLERPDRGRVACGEDVWVDTEAGIALAPERRRCGLVFQHYALFDHLSARDNVAYGLFALPRAERRARAEELLARFGLASRAEARPAELSGGERQRVAVARALAPGPRALLLDEPLSALDARTRAAAGRELAGALAQAEVPVALVTHDVEEAATLAERIGVLDAGRLVQIGTAAELAAEPASALVADLTGAVVLTGSARAGEDGLTSIALDGGGEIASIDRARGAVAVRVHPWDIALEPPDAAHEGSAQNRVVAEIASIRPVGNRVRVGLAGPQPLTAEITEASLRRLGLRRGDRVAATWKAAATRVVGASAPV
jgi:molybdate transport system ATP-binding protein